MPGSSVAEGDAHAFHRLRRVCRIGRTVAFASRRSTPPERSGDHNTSLGDGLRDGLTTAFIDRQVAF
jgi:hypothetical protein